MLRGMICEGLYTCYIRRRAHLIKICEIPYSSGVFRTILPKQKMVRTGRQKSLLLPYMIQPPQCAQLTAPHAVVSKERHIHR